VERSFRRKGKEQASKKGLRRRVLLEGRKLRILEIRSGRHEVCQVRAVEILISCMRRLRTGKGWKMEGSSCIKIVKVWRGKELGELV